MMKNDIRMVEHAVETVMKNTQGKCDEFGQHDSD